MRTALASVATIGILASFSVALAQENQPTGGTYCPHLTQNLQRCDFLRPLTLQHCTDATTNGEVTELQKFLVDYYDLNPDTYISGYFGRLTQNNVIRFQGEQGLPAFGYVGPLTRAAIARVCGTTSTPPPGDQSCQTPWGTTIQNNTSVTAYQASTVPHGQTCQSETRTCRDGTLTGSYLYQSCSVQTATTSPPTVSLLINGQQNVTVTPGSTFTGAWSSSNATSCNLTNAQGQTSSTPPNVADSSQGAAPAAGQTFTYTLSCTNAGGTTTKTATITGSTSGGGQVSFAVTPTSGTAPLTVSFDAQNVWRGSNHYYINFGDGSEGEMEHLSCTGGCFPNPLSASHTYATANTYTARLSVARDCSNTTTSCTSALQEIGTATITVTAPVASNVGACTFRGVQFAEGTSKTIRVLTSGSGSGQDLTITCDNGAWIDSGVNEGEQRCGATLSDKTILKAEDFGCLPNPLTHVNPRHGQKPFTVTIRLETGVGATSGCRIYDVSWGDGATSVVDPGVGVDTCGYYYTPAHTYSAVGSHTISAQARDPWGPNSPYPKPPVLTANIRVDGPVASANNQSHNQSQLASALAALESALRAILELLR